MSTVPTTHTPPSAPGMLSQVLGAIGLLLFFLPILGLPISAFGLLSGLLGVGMTFGRGGLPLRWSAIGSMVSALAVAVNLAIAYAPGADQVARNAPAPWQPVPDRPDVSPPARPAWGP